MKSTQLRKGGDSSDFFFLAMALWQLNEKDKARAWMAAESLERGPAPRGSSLD